MNKIFKKIEKWNYEFEMLIDGAIFSTNVVLKASYELVDKVYMYFLKNWNDTIVYFKQKNKDLDIEDVINWFWEELVFQKLKFDLDNQTWKLRNNIIETAIWFWLTLDDMKKDVDEMIEKVNFKKDVIVDSPNVQNKENVKLNPQQNSKKSIDEIINDIENDPDFIDDKDNLINILKEIDEKEKKEKEDKEKKKEKKNKKE